MSRFTEHRRTSTAVLTATLLLLGPAAASAHSIPLPEGTSVYAELLNDLTSRKKETATGDVVRARVASNVFIDDQLVIAEGAELLLRVRHAHKAKFLGRKGKVELEALSAKAIDGTAVPLTGVYVRTGKGRKLVTGALAVVVAWPFAFLRGKNARAPEGTVFEAIVDDDTWIDLEEGLGE